MVAASLCSMKSHYRIYRGICQICHCKGKILLREEGQDRSVSHSPFQLTQVLKPMPCSTIYISDVEISESPLYCKVIKLLLITF